ncbi:OmpA family protein [Exilibacterium tricleocarpae]|uniref:OmpA family protein n=1 Tax=Exilibacterium tricleocarpae TaxID=2591008 RepID=A0A545T1R4_9GAMM|nr:OmpA family protein [Exilibacterium tricleocarpae]TQV71145.1 OmpA family protein [Exilibacterium tricleocarpae]
MKKAIAITSLVVASTLAAPASFAVNTDVKQGAVFTTTTLAGAVLGGPVGFILGALGGAYMGEQMEKADTADKTSWKLAEAEDHIAELHLQLARANTQVTDLEALAMDSLEFQVLFHTGADNLTERGKQKVATLAKFLTDNPALSVRLVGHTDPRGTDEYNNVLADHRALAVQNALEVRGITLERIERRAFGASQSTAGTGDFEQYAMERRVDIEIFDPAKTTGIAQLK